MQDILDRKEAEEEQKSQLEEPNFEAEEND